ncbi:MAG: phosphoenolpyruvate carboxykinase (GTP) [Chlamydiae bacterium]|nr:phosphoenolpyruvate carboxykinase (GTP) [Chlamydiota bacterium]
MVELHNQILIDWIEKVTRLCRPEKVHFCDGSKEEYDEICLKLVKADIFTPLNPKIRPGSYWCHTHPADVARDEEATYICTKSREDAGPTNNWKDPEEMHLFLDKLFSGCMEGRTMYLIPFCMGPLNSNHAKISVQITDSPYVVVNMHLMTRMGKAILEKINRGAAFVPGLHSVGVPLKKGEKDLSWPCRNDQRYIVHFPEERSIFSFGSGYGGNALLGKKCLALRIGSYLGKEEGWMAEHMLIIGVTNPQGEKKYFAAAFPSGCGKTNLAMMQPALPGWKVECVGDDIAWIRFKEDGRLYAVNPEAGFFGIAPGTSYHSNPNAMKTIAKNTIFTNVAITKEGDVWWEGMTRHPPDIAKDWRGQPWTKENQTKAAHPNARFTVPLNQCSALDPKWKDPEGVPLSAIIFGGRRSTTIPLVFEALNWRHGVFLGTMMSSEMTAAAKGERGKLRHDPFAMLPFCGYNMGDYFAHWLEMGTRTSPEKLPKIFYVNWFLKDKNGKYLWPGFGENIRPIKWMFDRIDDRKETAIETPIGFIPKQKALDVNGLELSKENLESLLKVDRMEFFKEMENLEEYFFLFGDRMPKSLLEELVQIKEKLLLWNL